MAGTADSETGVTLLGRLRQDPTDQTGWREFVQRYGPKIYSLVPCPTPLETVVQVQFEEPVPPRRVQPRVPRDVETICLKCLHKEPRRRYASALELADELRRFLDGEPTVARPVGTLERAGHWCRRNPAIASLLGTVAAALLLGTAASSLFAVRERTQRARADLKSAEAVVGEQRARRHLYMAHLRLAETAWREGEVARLLELLEEGRPPPDQEDLRNFEGYYLSRLCHSDLRTLRAHRGRVIAVAYSPDGKRLAAACHDSTIKIWDVATGQEILTLAGNSAVHCVAPSFDGQRIADAATGREVFRLKAHSLPVVRVAFHPDGKQLASTSAAALALRGVDRLPPAGVKVLDTATGRESFSHAVPASVFGSVALSPDGRHLAGIDVDRW